MSVPNQNVHLSTREDLTLRSAQGLVPGEKGFAPQTGDVNSYKFNPDAFPSSLTDQNKINRVQDSPKIQNLKELLQLLVEKISISDPKIDMEILKESLEEFILLLKEIFKDGKKVELNALRISLWSMSSSGRSRILEAISVRDDANEEIQKKHKKNHHRGGAAKVVSRVFLESKYKGERIFVLPFFFASDCKVLFFVI